MVVYLHFFKPVHSVKYILAQKGLLWCLLLISATRIPRPFRYTMENSIFIEAKYMVNEYVKGPGGYVMWSLDKDNKFIVMSKIK